MTLQLPGKSLMRSVCFTDVLTFRELNGPNRRGRPRRHWAKTAIDDCWQGLSAAIMGPEGDHWYSYPTDVLRIERFTKSSTVRPIMQRWSLIDY